MRPPKPEAPTKKVGDQLTLTAPANRAEWQKRLDEARPRLGFLPRPEPGAEGATRKGCQKLSRSGLQGPKSDLADHLPPGTSIASYNFLTERWDQNEDELRAIAEEAARRARAGQENPIPWSDRKVNAPNRTPVAMLDRRGTWSPSTPATDKPLRAAMYKLRDGMRPLSQPRVQACGRAVISESGHVGVMATPDGRIKLTGLAHCGSIWECAVCQMQICQARADELRQAVDRHGSTKVAMLTLTIRHGCGDNLKRLRKGLSRAFGAFSRHRAYKRWQKHVGMVGRVRATEVTHGPNGWHPHLHVLIFFEDDVPTATAVGPAGKWRKVWDCPDFDELTELWQREVLRVFGIEHVPLAAYALKASMASDGEYIAKLGLELSDPANKKAKKGHRTPWQIASDWATARNKHRDDAGDDAALPWRIKHDLDARLWRTYCEDMRGAHRLVWSNGLKDRLGVVDMGDAELLEDDEPQPEDTWIASIPRATWRAIRDERIRGEPVPHFLIRAAERGGSRGFDKALLEVAAGECITSRAVHSLDHAQK